MDGIINILPSLFGITNEQFYTFLIILVTAANLVGRAIPDSATGILGTARKIAKTVGLYVGNRISPQVTANDVARAVVATVPDSVIKTTAGDLGDAVRIGVPYGEAAGNLATNIVDLAKGNQPSARFEGELPDGSPVPNEYRTDGPFQKQRRDESGKFLPKGA